MAAPSKFVWYELMTSDCDKGAAFYAKIFGYTVKDSGMPGPRYLLLSAGENGVGGAMDLTEEARARGVPPCWTGYIGVPDIARTLTDLQRLGGKVVHPQQDIPGVGYFAVVSDPAHAVFIVFEPHSTDDSAPDPVPGVPGFVVWNELITTDLQKVWPFYETLFGWEKGEAIDMGPEGIYQLYKSGDRDLGGMYAGAGPAVPPCWAFYFSVQAIGPALTAIKAEGGKVVREPMQVPGGSWIAHAVDPQGAFFALNAMNP